MKFIRFARILARLVAMTTQPATGRLLRRDAERNRKRILEGARHLFASRGLEPNLNDVAHHADVGVGTVYRHFATKEDLLEAIFADGLHSLVSLAETALEMDDSAQGLMFYIEGMCKLTATDRGLREIAFSKNYGGVAVKAAQDLLAPALTTLVERAQGTRRVRHDLSPTDLPFLGLIAGVVGDYAGHIDPQLWQRYVALLVAGILTSPGQHELPVAALTEDRLDAAMRMWEPAGAATFFRQHRRQSHAKP